ncbi:MAG: GAF domain-containing protein [Planctomycetales bacterium]|nr:GAF domain-containing protein [Planctomycetales bacterium]NIO46814.1 GAF domain-containing protein [Planctomycetales bacterium]
MAELCSAFCLATGWPLRYMPASQPVGSTQMAVRGRDSILAWSAPVDAGVGTAPGQLKIDLDPDATSISMAGQEGSSDSGPLDLDATSMVAAEGLSDSGPLDQHGHRCDWSAACDLAQHLAGLLNELGQASSALRDVRVELALSAPVYARPITESQLGQRIEGVLRAGVEALDCQAAAMYLLDEETSRLHLRASWGLSKQSVKAPPRELELAIADLEALVGHAVVLENDALFELWNVPEPQFGSAVCVPISTPTTLLGTFWVYCSQPRDFIDRETNLIEILAGRLAIELERELLLRQEKSRPT